MTVTQPAASRGRDTFLDLIRALAILAVVGQHWMMPVLEYHDGTVSTGNALATPGWWIITWLSQVMPLVFFAGGAANFISLHRAESSQVWLATRTRRLLFPVLALMSVWLVVPNLLRMFGIPEQPINVAGSIAGQLLWFLAVYLLTALATPLLAIAHRRWGVAVPLALAGAAALVDVARFNDVELIGYANALFVWLAVHQIGFFYADGTLTSLGRVGALGISAFGFGVTALLVAYGPYPASMIGMPGAPVSNMSPPSVLLFSLALGQIGLLLAARKPLTAFCAKPAISTGLRWLGARFMTVYLWHMPALIIVSGVTVIGLGYSTPKPGSTLWLFTIPFWLAMAATVLGVLLRMFGRLEGFGWSITCSASVRKLTTGMLAASAGLLGLAAGGFTTPVDGGVLSGPTPWACLVLTGFLLASQQQRQPKSTQERVRTAENSILDTAKPSHGSEPCAAIPMSDNSGPGLAKG